MTAATIAAAIAATIAAVRPATKWTLEQVGNTALSAGPGFGLEAVHQVDDGGEAAPGADTDERWRSAVAS